MPLSAVFTSAIDRAHLTRNGIGSAQAQSKGRIGILDGDTAIDFGKPAVGYAQPWLMQVGEPGSPLHDAMLLHIRSAALASEWLRSARTITRFDGVPTRVKSIGRQGVCALNQDNRRNHA